VAITAKGLVPEFQRYARGPVAWVHEGVHLPSFPRHVSGPAPALYRSEVAFVGNLSHPNDSGERYRLLRKIQPRFDLKVWGIQGDPQAKQRWGAKYPVIEWPAYNEDLVRICRGAAVVLGINHVNDVELYFSNRTFLTLASGGFHLTRYVPGLETMFGNREHLVWYHEEEECLRLIEYYLQRPRLRRRIAAAGKDWVRRRYGMKRQVNRILRMIGEQYGR
jgi:spore maturation protein CgeB